MANDFSVSGKCQKRYQVAALVNQSGQDDDDDENRIFESDN